MRSSEGRFGQAARSYFRCHLWLLRKFRAHLGTDVLALESWLGQALIQRLGELSQLATKKYSIRITYDSQSKVLGGRSIRSKGEESKRMIAYHKDMKGPSVICRFENSTKELILNLIHQWAMSKGC